VFVERGVVQGMLLGMLRVIRGKLEKWIANEFVRLIIAAAMRSSRLVWFVEDDSIATQKTFEN
jgi:hypothetical protein